MIEKFERKAELLKALAHPIRLAIVTGLSRSDGCNVNKMVENLKISQPMVSQHLNILKNAQVVKGYRKGSQICYRVENKTALNLVKYLETDN